MQTDSTQMQTATPTPQTIEKTPAQQELDDYMRMRQEEMQHTQQIQHDRDFEGRSLVPIFEMLIPLTLFIVTGIVLIKYFQNRHLERMQIIERGLDPVAYKELYGDPSDPEKKDKGMGALKWGLLAIFVGLGIFIGDFLHTMSGKSMDEAEFYYPASMLMSGGIGLIIYYNIASRKARFDREPKDIGY